MSEEKRFRSHEWYIDQRERFRAKHGWPNTLDEEIEYRRQYLMRDERDALERIADALEKLTGAAIRHCVNDDGTLNEDSAHIRIWATEET